MSKTRKIGNKDIMNKKEYLERIENLIINKIKYNAPNVVTDEVDFSLLDAIGIDGTMPIFIYSRPLDKLFYKAFYNVKKRIDFNLILTKQPSLSDRKIKLLNHTYILLDNEIGDSLRQIIEALNINYIVHSDFKLKDNREFIKFNDSEVNFDYQPYYFSKKLIDKGVVFNITNFILNGKNYIINLTNTNKQVCKASFEVNLPLPRGYYLFKKDANFIEVTNLTNRQKAYFNYHFKDAKISFSNMNGLDYCTYACVNLKCEVTLLPLQNKKCYFNFGDNKYCLFSPKDMQTFFEISQDKMNEIFDIKVTSHDKSFDKLFNFSLPYKIWSKWQNFDFDEKSENEWIKLRNQIITKSEKGEQISQAFKGLKEVKMYRNKRWKRVFIVHNNACYMFADKVKYFNYTLLTKEIFNKNNEIYLSFAD